MRQCMFIEALSTAPGSQKVPRALTGGWVALWERRLPPGLGLQGGCGQSAPPASGICGTFSPRVTEARHRVAQPVPPSPSSPGCLAPSRRPARVPFLCRSSWKEPISAMAPSSSTTIQSAWGRTWSAWVTRIRVWAGRDGIYTRAPDHCSRAGGMGQECPGAQSGESSPSCAPALFLKNSMSQQ